MVSWYRSVSSALAASRMRVNSKPYCFTLAPRRTTARLFLLGRLRRFDVRRGAAQFPHRVHIHVVQAVFAPAPRDVIATVCARCEFHGLFVLAVVVGQVDRDGGLGEAGIHELGGRKI